MRVRRAALFGSATRNNSDSGERVNREFCIELEEWFFWNER